jgi:hypothetical protein
MRRRELGPTSGLGQKRHTVSKPTCLLPPVADITPRRSLPYDGAIRRTIVRMAASGWRRTDHAVQILRTGTVQPCKTPRPRCGASRITGLFSFPLSLNRAERSGYLFQRLFSAAFGLSVILRPSLCPFGDPRRAADFKCRKASAKFFGVIASPPHPSEPIAELRWVGPSLF